MDTDLDTLVTALYVTTDDLLKAHPEQAPARPAVGIVPRISDAELIVLSVMQALLGYRSETRWLRRVSKDFRGMFPYVPGQSGYNKRLRKLAGTIAWLTGQIGALVSVADDDVWITDSTPVECGRSKETVKRSQLAGWAEYGYCASHSRFFWDSDCIWSAPCTASRSAGRWSARRPMSVTCWKTSSPPPPP